MHGGTFSVLVYLYIVKLLIMKRIIPAILLLLSLTGCYNSGEPRERVLKIYNWADYIGDGVLEDFQAYYKEQTGENIRIVYQTFDINEIMLTKIE